VQEALKIGGERREDRRYDLMFELRWKVIRRRQVAESGSGHTVDLSRGGVRFYSGCCLPVGSNVNLSISWPVLLHNVAPMLLSIQGKVVRSEDGWAAIRTLQHEFRTQGIPRERHNGTVNGQAAQDLSMAAAGPTLKKSY
jgi:hypothetical protein